MSVTMYSECDCGARTPDAHLGDCRVGKLEAELATRDALLREVEYFNFYHISGELVVRTEPDKKPDWNARNWIKRRDELLGEQE